MGGTAASNKPADAGVCGMGTSALPRCLETLFRSVTAGKPFRFPFFRRGLAGGEAVRPGGVLPEWRGSLAWAGGVGRDGAEGTDPMLGW